LGDGWLSTSVGPDSVGERLHVLRGLCEVQGRRFEDLSLCHKFFINIGEAEQRSDGSRVPGTGTPADIRDDIRRFVDIGYDRFIVRYRGGDAEAQRVQLQQFMAEVMAQV
jgi:alkanesulfonate monooxygenase SsuD/methylene tetrahydromethanopterin reductase-like flavin-dependent oxidoreductase (luciferase family)